VFVCVIKVCFSLGLVFNVVVTICLSKVLYRVLIGLSMLLEIVFLQGFVLVPGCFVNVVVFLCLSKVLYKVSVGFQCCCDCLFKQGVVLVVGWFS